MSFEIEIRAEDQREYVPDVGDNVALCESWDGVGEPPYFWVDLLPLSKRDLTKIQTTIARQMKKGGSAKLIAAGREVVRRCISQYVPAVHNLTLTDRSTGQKFEPKTGEELFEALEAAEPALAVVIDDIESALMDGSKADEGDLGKLRLPSATSGQEAAMHLLPGNGNAQGVATTTTLPGKMTSAHLATATER